MRWSFLNTLRAHTLTIVVLQAKAFSLLHDVGLGGKGHMGGSVRQRLGREKTGWKPFGLLPVKIARSTWCYGAMLKPFSAARFRTSASERLVTLHMVAIPMPSCTMPTALSALASALPWPPP